MRSQTARTARRGMTAAELLALPASIDMETLFRAIGIGRTKGYELLRDGELPVKVLRLGATTYRARTADVLELLGIDPGAAIKQTGGDAA